MSDLHLRNLPVPFFSQRKNTYIYKEKYTKDDAIRKGNPSLAGQIKPDGKEYSMACNSCNITSLAMVLHYFGVTADSPDDMMISYFKETHKEQIESAKKETATFKNISYYGEKGVDALEQWGNLYGIAKGVYGLDCEVQAFSFKKIKESVAQGFPVMISVAIEILNTDKSQKGSGHVVVVRGFAKTGSKSFVIINDPWGVQSHRGKTTLVARRVFFPPYPQSFRHAL